MWISSEYYAFSEFYFRIFKRLSFSREMMGTKVRIQLIKKRKIKKGCGWWTNQRRTLPVLIWCDKSAYQAHNGNEMYKWKYQ